MNYLDDVAARIRRALPTEATAPDRSEGLFRIYAVLVLAKGQDTTAEDVHNAWVAWMAGRQPDHESLIPFRALSASTQSEDTPYLLAIHQVAMENETSPPRRSGAPGANTSKEER